MNLKEAQRLKYLQYLQPLLHQHSIPLLNEVEQNSTLRSPSLQHRHLPSARVPHVFGEIQGFLPNLLCQVQLLDQRVHHPPDVSGRTRVQILGIITRITR